MNLFTVDQRCWLVLKGYNYILGGDDDKTLTNIGPEDCQRRCLTETDYVCLTINYHRDKRECELNSRIPTGPYAFSDIFKNHTYYERVMDCKPDEEHDFINGQYILIV